MNTKHKSLFTAITTVGRDLLVIKGDKVIGKARAITQVGSHIGVMFTDGEILDMVKNIDCVRSMGNKHSYFRFYALTGEYIGTYDLTGIGSDDILWDVYVVDEFNFRWGMVPEHFSCVPGYQTAMEE